MPDALQAAVATPGLSWLILISLTAGLVYGFAGFGAALIFMPLASLFLSPAAAVGALSVSSIGSFVTLVPHAWSRCDKRAVVTMLLAAFCLIPAGVWILRISDPTVLRLALSVIVLATLAMLVAGWRYRQSPGVPAWIGVGGVLGFMGGATGLNGPVLVLFQLGGQDSVDRSRANTVVVLTTSSLGTLPFLAMQGVLSAQVFAVGLLLFVPYGAGALAGRKLFTPARAGLYRITAYLLIGVAGLAGLPVLG